MISVQFDLADRLILMAILPAQGSMLTMATAAGIQDKMKIKPDEMEKYGMTEEGSRITWKTNAATTIELATGEVQLLKTLVSATDTAGEVTMAQLATFQKILAISTSGGGE